MILDVTAYWLLFIFLLLSGHFYLSSFYVWPRQLKENKRDKSQ